MNHVNGSTRHMQATARTCHNGLLAGTDVMELFCVTQLGYVAYNWMWVRHPTQLIKLSASHVLLLFTVYPRPYHSDYENYFVYV